MASLGKSNFSKLMSVLLSLIMVLSTMSFTLPIKVKADATEIFYEDFEDYDSSTNTVDTTVVTGATLDGTTVDGETVTWADAADGTADATTKIGFVDGVLQIDKGKHSHGGQLTTVTLATGFASHFPASGSANGYDTTGTGYYVFETDFTPISISPKTTWNEYNGEIAVADGSYNVVKMTLSSSNGLQDLIGADVTSAAFTAVDDDAANGALYKNNMGTAEGLEGKKIRIRVIYDIKNYKTLSTALVDGETGSRISSLGWHKTANSWHRMSTITLRAENTSSNTHANYQFDNIKLLKYPSSDALSLTSSTMEQSAENVALSGSFDLTFSGDIDAGSIKNIKLKKGDGTLITPDSVAMNGTNGVTVAYSGLEELSSYSVTTNDVVLSKDTGLPVVCTDISFTTLTTKPPVTSVGTVLWSENFDGLDSTTLDALVAEDATARRGWSARVQASGGNFTSTDHTWKALADGTYAESSNTNRVILGNGKATLIKSKAEAHGGYNATLWGSPSFTMPTEGYLVFDADYKATSMPKKSGSNNYNGDIVLFNGTETAANERAHWSLSTTSGMQDLLGYSESTVLTDYANNMGTSEGLANKTIHVQFIYDLENGKVITVATPLGEATRVSSKGWVDFDKETFVVPTFKFDLRDANGSGTAEVTYDNVMFRSVVDRAFTFTSSSVENGATNVTTGGTIDLTFSEEVSKKSLDNITLSDGENTIDCDVTIDETNKNIVHVSYDGLAYNTGYTLNVPLSVVADATNHPLTAAQTISFTTKTMEPLAVASTTPADNATGVAVDSDVTITFNDSVSNYEDITLSSEGGTVEVTKTLSADKMTVTLVPAEDLDIETVYTITVPTTVSNLAGNAVGTEVTSSFTTVSPPPTIDSVTPANNTGNAELDTNIVVTFSKAMNEESLANITLKAGDAAVAHTKTYADNVLTINPDSDLARETTYTLTIPTTVTSTFGVALEEQATYTFTTKGSSTVAWSQDFDAIDALSGDALDEYMAANHYGWTAQIGTAWAGTDPNYYLNMWSAKNFALNNATTGFKWSEAPTKYQEMIIYTNSNLTETTSGQGAGSIDFVNGRIKLGVPEKQGSGSTETRVTIPINNVSVAGKDYAVFEFDYYTDKMTGRVADNVNFATGDIMLRNTAGNNIAKINISTTTGLSDIADLATVNADTLADAVDNIGPDDNLTGKIVHFKVVFDIANNRYKVSATPEGGATMVRDDGAWISLPANVTVDGFNNVYMALKDYNKSNWSVQSFAEYDNFKITTVEGNPEIASSSLDGITEPISVASELKLYFTEAMDEDTLSKITLVPTAGGDAVTLTPELSNGGKVVTLKHSALTPGTTYTLDVPVDVTSALGIPLAVAGSYEFTTDGTAAPTVAGTVTNGAPNITLDKLLRFTFSEAIVPGTASGITLKKQDSDVNLITGYEWSNGDTVVTLFHETMEANATYTLEIPNTVVSASSGLPVYASYTFTTGDFATNVIWSENFDGLTNDNVASNRTNWSTNITFGDPTDKNGAVTKSTSSSTLTWADADTMYANQVKLENGKLGLTKKSQGHGGTGTYVTIPITTSSTPTSGYAVVEFDYMSTYFKAITASNHYTNDITLTGKTDNKPLLKLNIDRNYGVQDVLNPDEANAALSYATISAAPYVNNICSVAGLAGKKLHFQVVYDVENKKYMVSVTPEGGTRIVRNSDWIYLPDDITTIDFKQLSLNLKQNSGSYDANAWYDNIKIWETSELPEIVTSTVEGNPEVKVDHDIVLRFTKPMNLASLKNITLVANETPVAVTPLLSNGGRTVLLSHPELETGATYTLTLPATVTSELGLPLAATEYTFTTIGERGDVAIDSATVTDGAKNIPVDRELTINFTDEVTEASVSSITLTKQGEETNLITGYTVNGTSVTLAHDNFDLSETYVLTVPAKVKSEASGIGITEPSIYTFTTLGEADVDVLWSENFDGRSAGDGNWDVSIVSPIQTDESIDTDNPVTYTQYYNFAWSEGSTKYKYNDIEHGVKFDNDRYVLTMPGTLWHGSMGVVTKIPLTFSLVEDKGYAVFEFDYFTTAMSRRAGGDAWNNGDVRLVNSEGVVIAKLQMSKQHGIQDILNPAGGNTQLSSAVIGAEPYKDNICAATDMENKTLHFKVVYDVENLKYLITMTPEGGAPIVRDGGWQSLPEGTKINFNSLVLELKEYPSSTTASVNAQYDNIKFSLVSDNPVLLSTSVDGSPEISVDGEISLTFDEPVYDASLLNVTIVPNEGEAAEITGVELSNDGKTATLKHKHFANSKTYTLTVPETVMSASGVPMEAAQIRTFTTDNVPAPTIDGATVTDNATGIALNKVIEITLSEPFDEETIEGITLTVKDSDVNLITDYTLSQDNTVVTLAHDNFALNTQYVLTVPDTVKGVSGITVEETVYTFTTYANEVTATINVAETEVALDADLQLTFAEAITDTNISNITLSVKDGDSVAVTPTLDGAVVSLNNVALKGSTTYVVTIPAGLIAQNGAPVAEATFEFTTAEVTPPTVTEITVSENEEDVLLDRVISVTLSEAFKSGTEDDITLTVEDSDVNLITEYQLSNENKTVTLVHDDFAINTTYVLTIPTTVASAVTDVAIEEEIVRTFSTYESEITATLNATGNEVPAGTALQLTFAENINETGIENITLSTSSGDVDIEPTLSGNVVSLGNGALDYETEYTVTIPSGLTATNGIPVAEDTFTFTTKAFDPVLWEEDFTTLPEGVTANTSVESWYTDGWSAYVQASGYVENMNEFKFVDGKLQMTKGQSETTKGKGLYASKTILGAPALGLVTLDYDYTISEPYLSDAYAPTMAILNTNGQQLLALNFGSAYFGTWINKTGINSGAVNTGVVGGGNEDNTRVFARGATNYAPIADGGEIHVKVTLNLDEGTYSVVLTTDGKEYRTPTGLFNIDPGITNYQIGQVVLFASNATTPSNYTEETKVVSTYDNFVLQIAQPVVPEVSSSSVTNGQMGVPADEAIEVVFSTEMKESTLSDVTLVRTSDSSPVTLTPTLASDFRTASFAFDTLDAETQYTLTIPATVESATGGTMAAPVTYTFTTAGEGTVYWYETFDGLTNENVGTLRPTWTGTANDYTGGEYKTHSISAGEDWTVASNEENSSRIIFNDNITLQDRITCGWIGLGPEIDIKFGMANYPPSSGYLVFEFDYFTNKLANANDSDRYINVVLDDQGGSSRVFGKLNFSKTYGIQDLYSETDAIPAMTEEEFIDNVRKATDIEGKNVHIQYVFDAGRTRYMISATVDGEKTFRTSDWIEITNAMMTPTEGMSSSGQYYFSRIHLRQYETTGSVGEDGIAYAESTYDNFFLTHYTADKAPSFDSATIDDNATDVARTGSIDVTFSKRIDETSICNITLAKQDGTPVDVDVVMNGDRGVTVNYKRLDAETTYVLTVPKIVTDFNGLPLTEAVTRTFTTDDTVLPEVAGATVTNGATNITLDKVIAVTFNEAIDEDTIENITLTAKDSEENLITGYTLSQDGTVVTLAHADFDMNTEYVLTIPETVKGAVTGLGVAETVYNFKTYEGEVTSTFNIETSGVATDAQLQITFESAVSQAVAESITLSVKNGDNVTVSPTVTDNVVSLNNASLRANKTYVVTIPDGLFAENGVPVEPKTFEFATVTLPAPTVTTSTLAGKTTDVLLDEVITVTFSEPIVESTLAGIKLTVSGEESDLITSRTLSQDGTVVTLTHDNFTMNTDYVLTVPATIMGANSDLTLEEAVVYNFKTYESELVATINAAGNEVAADTNIQLTFTKDIAEDNISNIKLKDGDEEVSIAPSVSGGVISLNNATLDYETTYTVIIPDNLKSTGGIPVAAGQEFTFTTAHEGELLWYEYFDDTDPANHSDWQGTIAHPNPENTDQVLWKYTSNSTMTWEEAANGTYPEMISFEGNKLTLYERKNTGHGSAQAKFRMSVTPTTTYRSGYNVLEFDYSSTAMATRNKYNEVNNIFDIIVNGKGDRTYGKLSITKANGGQDLFGIETINTDEKYTNIVAGTHKNNIMSTEGYNGETLHITYIFDLANKQYMVSISDNNEKSFNGSEWIGFTSSNVGADPSVDWFVDELILILVESNLGSSEFATATYDNFEYRHYTTLPSFVEATVVEDATVEANGTFDILFSKPIDPATISNISILDSEDNEAGKVTTSMVDEETVRVTYSRLDAETTYKLVIPKTVTDTNGLPLAAEQTINFTTDVIEIAAVDYYLAVSADKDIYNAGETVTVDIIATDDEGYDDGFSSFGFTFDYDDTALQLTNVTTALTGDLVFNAANGMVAFESGGGDIAVAEEGTVIATATFTVLDASGTKEIALTDAEMTPSGYDGNKAPTTTPKAITLYNIKVNFKAGSGVTLDGGDRTAYVKYGESTLYTDTTYAASFQIPTATADTANGWTLIDATRYWKNNGNTLTADEIRAVVYTASVTYTATAYKEFTVTVNAGEHGEFVDVAQTTFTATSGTMLGELELPAEANIVPAEGYVFIGWSINGGDPITVDQLDTYEVTEHMELVAQYTEGSFAFTVNAFENGEIAELSGVTNNKATYKTNVTFKVAATTDGYYAETVTCQVDGGTPYTLYPNASGLYTVPGEDITDTVTITVEMSTYLTMTFKAGTGTTMTTVTAYKKSGNSSMYSSFASLIAGTPDFDVPVPEASEGYRLPTDEVGEELWTDGENPYTTVAIADGIFDTNKVFTAVAVQQYRVTFTASEHSTFAQDAETVLWVDYGTTGIAVPELEFEEGYVLKEWQQGGLAVNPAEAEITENTEFVAVEKRAQYDVIVSAPDGVTITSEQIVDDKVEYGTTILFTINNNGAVITGVTYQIGTGSVETLADVDGVYTIPYDVITDTVTITITKANSFTVTFAAEGNGSVSPADTVVTAGETIAEEPAITPDPGYAFIGWFDEGDNEVELLEEIINGNVTYTAKFEIITRTITANGLTLTYDEDYNLPQIGKDVKFTVSSNNGVVTHVYYAVGEDEPELLTATNGVYTIEGANITGNITITAKVIENATAEVVSGYYDMVKLQGEETTKDLFILKTDKLDGARYIFNGGAPMYWSPKYEAYVALVTDGTTLEELVAGIATTDVDVENYTIMMGDVNGNGLVTAADAGIVNDCLHKQRQSGLSDKQILAMDVEWDAETKAGYQVITTGDIERILWIAVNE